MFKDNELMKHKTFQDQTRERSTYSGIGEYGARVYRDMPVED